MLQFYCGPPTYRFFICVLMPVIVHRLQSLVIFPLIYHNEVMLKGSLTKTVLIEYSRIS